jgi:hypothetical protein
MLKRSEKMNETKTEIEKTSTAIEGSSSKDGEEKETKYILHIYKNINKPEISQLRQRGDGQVFPSYDRAIDFLKDYFVLFRARRKSWRTKTILLENVEGLVFGSLIPKDEAE